MSQTFILRLLVDTEHPGELRGALYSVADSAEYPFADAETLLAQLRCVTSLQSPPSADERDGARGDVPEERPDSAVDTGEGEG